MALSSSESELLTNTCKNMNIAAETCREVLDILRNLGSTGVVDIATHNTASTAHANATNLAKLDSDGSLMLGATGDLGITNVSYAPFYLKKYSTAKAYFIASRSVFDPVNKEIHRAFNQTFIAENGDLIAKSNLHAKFNQYSLPAYRMESYCSTNDGNDRTLIDFILGAYSDQAYKATSIKFGMNNFSGSYNYAYEFNTNALIPYSGQTISLGLANLPFDTAYFRTAATVTSDRREKSGISALGSEAVEFVKALRPVQFTVKNGRQLVTEADGNGEPITVETTPGTRRHWGLIAQEVKEALSTAGYEDAAVWCLADKNDPDSKQSLRYEELIAPMIKVIQNQQERIEALERKVA